MARQAPKVLDGARGPRADRFEDMREQAEATYSPAPRVAPEGTTYMSAFSSYCVLVSAPADVVDPITGRKTVQRPTKAQFKDGRYVNNAKDKKLRDWIDSVLQSNTRFGKPGSGCDFWLAEDAIRMTKAAAKANATETLKRLAAENRDEFDKLVAELQQGDATDEKMPAAPVA